MSRRYRRSFREDRQRGRRLMERVTRRRPRMLREEDENDRDKREIAADLAAIWDTTTGEALDYINALDPYEPGDRRTLAAAISREYEGLSVDDVLEVLADAEEEAMED